MRLILSLVLAVGAIVGSAAPASAAKAKATLTVSPTSAIQGNKVTVTLTAAAYTGYSWSIQYYADGDWDTFCSGEVKTKKGVLKCVGLLPLEGNNTFRAQCVYCGASFETILSNKKVIKGKPAPGSPKNPVAVGKFLNVGDDTKKVGVLKVAKPNWNAAREYCSKFTNDDIYSSSSSQPCTVASVEPEWGDTSYYEYTAIRDTWKLQAAIPNPSYSKKLVSMKVTYKQTSSGSGYIPDLELRQTNGRYVDSLDLHPGFETPEGFYFYERTIRNSAVVRTAYFEVAKNITSGHLAIRGYSFGEFATKGLYTEAWMKLR
jgi:hypothetical protein